MATPTTSQTDAELIRQFVRDKSESAFRFLTDRHVNLVFGTAFRRTSDRGVAEEITQNVYFAFSKDFHASYNTQLEVRTINGVVILTGYIEEASEIKRIAEIARGVAGVKSVDNRLSVKSAF